LLRCSGFRPAGRLAGAPSVKRAECYQPAATVSRAKSEKFHFLTKF
jgi:hypothetical protein